MDSEEKTKTRKRSREVQEPKKKRESSLPKEEQEITIITSSESLKYHY